MKKWILLLIIFSLFEISLALYVTYWRESFWNSIATKSFGLFINDIIIFTFVALLICFISGLTQFFQNLGAIEWRKILDKNLRYKYPKIGNLVDNINQRHQEDCMKYPDLSLTLIFGIIKSSLYVIVFSISLIINFSSWYLLILFSYAIFGTIVSKLIAKPLIKLNYEQQKNEATYRNNLSESNFDNCIYLMFGIARKTKHLTYFQYFYSQIGVIIPVLIIFPYYFSSTMTLGHLMRFTSLSSTILDNTSYGVNSFNTINQWLSCRIRLKEIGVI